MDRHDPRSDGSADVHDDDDEVEGDDADDARDDPDERDERDEIRDDTAEDDTGEQLPPGIQATTRRGLLLVGVLILGLVIGRVTAPDAESTEDTTPTETQGLPFPTGDVDRTNYWGLAGLIRTAGDTFDRPDGDLGRAETDQEWDVVAGDWGVVDNAAGLLQAADRGPNLAVLADGTGPGLTEVTMSAVAPGTGLVFRHLDADNHWTVIARPGTGTWAVHRILEGEDQLVGEFEGDVADGVTVTVIQNEEVLRFLIDGEDQFLLNDPELSDQRQGGLVAPARFAGDTRWDRFLLMGFGNQG